MTTVLSSRAQAPSATPVAIHSSSAREAGNTLLRFIWATVELNLLLGIPDGSGENDVVELHKNCTNNTGSICVSATRLFSRKAGVKDFCNYLSSTPPILNWELLPCTLAFQWRTASLRRPCRTNVGQ